MALFKISKGLNANLPTVYNEGWCYFTTDDGKFYIDTSGSGGTTGTRVVLNAEYAEHLTKGNDFFRVGNSIPNDSDLNTYTTVGKYYCNSESQAQTLGNCPTKTNFTLLVLARTSSNTSSLIQIVIDLSGRFYIRSCASNNSWRDWKKFVDQDSLDTALAELTTRLDSHTHTIDYTPAGTIANTSIAPQGSVSSSFTGSSKKSNGPSATVNVAKGDHVHAFTPAGNISTPAFTGDSATISASYTPAGTVSQPTFNGTSVNTNATISNSQTSAASSGHTHTLIAAGTVSQPTFNGTAATLTTSFKPAGTISTPTFNGTSAKSGGPSANVSVAQGLHTHTVTARGSVSAPTFIGNEATLTANYTPSGTVGATFSGSNTTTNATPNNTTHRVNVASSGHTHSYTPAGTITAPTFNGTQVNSGSPSANTNVASSGHTHNVTAAGYINCSVANRCLTLSLVFNAVTSGSPSANASVASSGHTHTVTAQGNVSAPTFTGSNISTSGPSANTSVPKATHTHTLVPLGNVTNAVFSGTQNSISIIYTPTGTVTEPTFTGSGSITDITENIINVATYDHTHNTTATGTITKPTFNGSTGNISISYTPAGTVSQPTFSGTSVTSNGPNGTVTVATGNHVHSVIAAGTVTQPTFNGTAATISTSYTPTGSVSKPTFTGTSGNVSATVNNSRVNVATNAHTHNTTATGNVVSVFTGTAANHTHTFNGTTATLTASAINPTTTVEQ